MSYYVLMIPSQITTYLGKRDFVDHIEHIDPVGELSIVFFSVTLTFFYVCIVPEQGWGVIEQIHLSWGEGWGIFLDNFCN